MSVMISRWLAYRIHQYRRDPRLLLRAARELPTEEYLRMLIHAKQESPDIIERFLSFMQISNTIARPAELSYM